MTRHSAGGDVADAAQDGGDDGRLFLVSGGGRGITSRCVVALAGRFGGSFVLLGRTSVEGDEPVWAKGADGEALRQAAVEELRATGERLTPVSAARLVGAVEARREVLRTVADVSAAGGRATYLSVDVTDAAALRNRLEGVVAATSGPVTVIHGAGVLADGPIGRKRAADFDAVVGVKVDGLANLLTAVPPDRLDTLVLFSSAAGFFGNPGQTDYAMANEILNKAGLLIHRRHPACRVVALNWGPWEGGMVDAGLERLFLERGITLISAADGAAVLADELARSDRGPLLVVGSGPVAPRPAPIEPGQLRPQRIRRRLTLAANPFVRHHVINGRAVLPAVAAGSWIINGCRTLYPCYELSQARDFRVYKGVVFDRDDLGDFVLEVTPAAPLPEYPDALVLDARITSETAGARPQPRYAALVVLERSRDRPVPRLSVDLDEGDAIDGETLYGDGTLFHGPYFRGIRRVLGIRPGGLTAECVQVVVPERDQGQFPVNGFNHFAADVGFQAILVLVRRTVGAASLPLMCGRCETFAPIPFGQTFYATVTVTSRDDTGLTADVALHDRAGACYLVLHGAEVTIDAALDEKFRLVDALH